MKTLLINPPWSKEGYYGVRAGSRWPHLEDCGTSAYMPFPFFMAYAAAVLQRAGKPVSVIDACAERLDKNTCFKRSPILVNILQEVPALKLFLNILIRNSAPCGQIFLCVFLVFF